jgi:hypothetical protein
MCSMLIRCDKHGIALVLSVLNNLLAMCGTLDVRITEIECHIGLACTKISDPTCAPSWAWGGIHQSLLRLDS